MDENGGPQNWTGFYGNLACNGPCQECQLHDDDFWGGYDDPFGDGWGDDGYGDGYGDNFGGGYEEDEDGHGGNGWG